MKDNYRSAIERRNEATALITSGHIGSAVWYLAWPSVINTVILSAYNLINRIFLGRLPNSTDSQAAVGVGNVPLMLQFALTIGLAAGTSALVSRFLGAEQHDDAEEAARQSVTLSVIVGIVTGIPILLGAGWLVKQVGASSAVLPLAQNYTQIITLFSVPNLVWQISIAILRSQGDAKSPLYTGAMVIGLNIFLDWILILGGLGAPRMGVHGAAISTGIARVAGMMLALWFLRRSALGSALTHLRCDFKWFGRILSIGWPASVQNLVMTLSSGAYLRILSLLPNGQGTTAQAAYTVALSIESLAFMPGVAYSTAATPLVGQNLGAGKPDRAVRSTWVATGQAVFIMSLVAATFVAIPHYLAMPFTSDAALIPIIVAYLRINSFSEPFLAVNMVMRGALQGAGDTRIPAIITFMSLWLVRLPMEWFLAIHLGWGAPGAWWAMSLTAILSGILMAVWFKWGNWKDIRV